MQTYGYFDRTIEYILMGGAPLEEADYVVIGFHGIGGNDDKMYQNLAETYESNANITYMAPASANGSWFDNWFVEPNNVTLLAALDAIDSLISALEAEGIPHEKIVLAGHSQGSTLVAEYAARRSADDFHSIVLMSAPYNGIAVPDEQLDGIYQSDLQGQPIRLAVHDNDPKVPIDLMIETMEFFQSLGAQVDLVVHPGVTHRMTEGDHEILRTVVDSTEGTSEADVMPGTGDADLIYGFDGPDQIAGGAGGDTLLGGDGDDTIDGGGGDDFIYAGFGNDLVEIGGGNDTAHLGSGDDTVTVTMRDVFHQSTRLWGGDGEDTLQVVLTSQQALAKLAVKELGGLQAHIESGSGNDYAFRNVDATAGGFEHLEIVAPVAAKDDQAWTDEDTAFLVDVLQNDRDLLGDVANLRHDNAKLSIIALDAGNVPAGADLSITSDGRSLLFDPGGAYQDLSEGEAETLTVAYTVADDQGFLDVAALTITIHGATDPVDLLV